jgi:hypothetical protein
MFAQYSLHRAHYPLLLVFRLCSRPHSQSRTIFERRLFLLPGALGNAHDALCLCISRRISLVTCVVQHSCHCTRAHATSARVRADCYHLLSYDSPALSQPDSLRDFRYWPFFLCSSSTSRWVYQEYFKDITTVSLVSFTVSVVSVTNKSTQ